ncbi:hypothetical protein P8C59_008926 [Phyllachora maydis]|uniref:Uncharacterized protein n=1 Tax=Phyllachora maydis TaxID=1825666 RepID=A0AAD9IC29_9PEZI|nr:hypothetical protein P8C59_008926 [Phyllachora maydis]
MCRVVARQARASAQGELHYPEASRRKPVEHAIDCTPEYDEFIAKLKDFHEARGTPFEAEPKMGNLTVDLLKLFNLILENGGYDKVSEEKLKWRQMCDGLGLSRTNAPADAYALKQIFYKNLAAWEIKTIHNREPPPPEILEFVTAKGGSLLTRTLENFHARGKQPGAPESPRSGDDGTPSRERKADETPSSGRASRELPEPSRRIIIQPVLHLHRIRNHTVKATQQLMGMAACLCSRRYSRLPFGDRRTLDTPSSNPEAFAKRQRLLRQPAPTANPYAILRHYLPAAHLEGPNIYERCLLALRSCIPAEQAFALNHLVKISYERGDKYKFVQFHGLAEGLTEKALEVGSLFYHVNWRVCYDPEMEVGLIDELDGVNGTLDILERISRLRPKDVQDGVQSADFTDQTMLITEAVLTMRNMVMLPENAYFMSDFITLKDLLCIILTLPNRDVVVELKHCALDIAEQITPFLILDADDPLYRTLLAQLKANDRGIILTVLRAIGRIAMNSPTETNKLDAVPSSALRNIMEWLLLNDDELMDACLDFLYQYTAVVSNLEVLLQTTSLEHLVGHLVRLMSHGAKKVHKDLIVSPEKQIPSRASDEVVPIPKDLLDRLLAMDEPERCYSWLRCLFEEDPDSQITQIAIWQAYNTAFLEPLKKGGRTMINAAEFIRNISQWTQTLDATGGHAARCGDWHLTAEKMWEHILVDHVGEKRGEDNKFHNKEITCTCRWAKCVKYPKPATLQLFAFGGHVKTHIMAEARSQAPHSASTADTSGPNLASFKRPKPKDVEPAKIVTLTYEETAIVRDERNPNGPPQAAGIPLSAILVLRNIARNVGKTKAEEALLKAHELGGEAGGWNERLFRPVTPRLFEIMTENRVLAPHVASLLQLLEPLN